MTDFQRELLALLARNRTPDSHLAGGAGLHIAPNSARYSDDLDFFHDSAERVATAYQEDLTLLDEAGYEVSVVTSQPGLIRTVVSRDGDATRVDWAHDSAWRFLPPVRDEVGGYVLHEVDLAINKVLALAGRNEARDFVDILHIHEHVLPLGAVVWAASGKDPGFSPLSLLEQLRRRGRFRQEDFDRLALAEPLDAQEAKKKWLAMLDQAEAFIRSRPAEEVGALYYDAEEGGFAEPIRGPDLAEQGLQQHYGTPGGVLPRVAEAD